MTEERIKELAEKCYEILPAWNNEDDAIATIAAYLRTVATEAREEGRKEGIDEIRDVMLPLLVFQDKKVIEEQAERLKKEKS